MIEQIVFFVVSCAHAVLQSKDSLNRWDYLTYGYYVCVWFIDALRAEAVTNSVHEIVFYNNDKFN